MRNCQPTWQGKVSVSPSEDNYPMQRLLNGGEGQSLSRKELREV